MLNFLDSLDTWFGKLTNFELIVRFAAIGDLLAVHPAYQDPFPDGLADAAQIKAMVASFKVKVDAAAGQDRARVAERNKAREELVLAVTLVARYIEIRATIRQDPSMLEHTGFRIKSRGSKSSAAATVSPEVYSLKKGNEDGSVVVTAKRHPGKVSYIIEMCKGDPANGGIWTYIGHFLQCKNVITKLETAMKVYFRIRYDINGNLSEWSAPVGIIVT
ncbi:hypothetical protein [Geomesophilobacter sediminis]|uniref:Uncharacterized protein n=1 Tax=Geomesophilobacter sediminis TaxID=2798584 RepID=A0A8J7M2B6_9BACT|nr:hypothetical protein [Geomesophilobacter sediminis]MBJ6727352.1 hypothetical protein [Geomesophilobacter sediminis]